MNWPTAAVIIIGMIVGGIVILGALYADHKSENSDKE